MRNLKYVAFLMSIGLLGFSPTVVHADNTDVAIVQEDVGQVAEPPEDTLINSGVATGSTIEASVPSSITYEKKEIQLDSIPSDLRVDLPTNITLEALNDNQYGYTDKIKISCDSDNEYRVELSLKDTDIVYASPEGNTISGVATIGDSTSYSWSYEDIASGLEIPLSVVVDKPEYTGSYTTALNFSINVYQMQEVEVKAEENASDAKDTEKVEDTNDDDEATAPKENTSDEDKDVTSEDEVVKDDTQVSDNTEAQPSTSEENTVVADDSTSSGVAFENTDILFISKDITSITPDAFDNLDLLKVINYEGTEEEWNKIFTGSLKSGVVLNFNSSITDDSTVAPTESTSNGNKENTQVSDDIGVLPSTDEENAVINDCSDSSGVVVEDAGTLFISEDVTNINVDAFDNL